MNAAQRKKIGNEVKTAVDNMKNKRGITMSDDTKNIIALADNRDCKLVIDVSQYADIQTSMNLILAEAAQANTDAILADNSDVMNPFFQVLRVMRTVIDEVI
jgi:hypothetical protein